MLNHRNSINTNMLISTLYEVEKQISVIAQASGTSADNLGAQIDLFSCDDQKRLLGLLREKLSIQKNIYSEQGGLLDNVSFLTSYR